MHSQTSAQVNGTRIKSPIVKRSVVVAGHKTSVSLEEPFWTCLREIADAQQAPVSKLVGDIEAGRSRGNLSSAIRIYVLNKVRGSEMAAPTIPSP